MDQFLIYAFVREISKLHFENNKHIHNFRIIMLLLCKLFNAEYVICITKYYTRITLHRECIYVAYRVHIN